MSNKLQTLIERIRQLGLQAACVHQEAIILMKELEQVSAPLPERGKKKKGSLSDAQLGKYVNNRLKQIKQH